MQKNARQILHKRKVKDWSLWENMCCYNGCIGTYVLERNGY